MSSIGYCFEFQVAKWIDFPTHMESNSPNDLFYVRLHDESWYSDWAQF